ncbi:hypothetical protein N7513_001847 [Penicillium frequentans]|nr:hypothetical protein N7513_001847 [Penicillium glabrum]
MDKSNMVELPAQTQVPGRTSNTPLATPCPAESGMPPREYLPIARDETGIRLEKEDPKLASQGARLLGIFRRMWESCATKNLESERIENMNQDLRAVNAQVCHEEDHLKHRQDEQLARFYKLEGGFD